MASASGQDTAATLTGAAVNPYVDHPRLTPSCPADLNRAFTCSGGSYRTWYPTLAGGCPTLTQDWGQLAFEEVEEPMLVRPDLDKDDVVRSCQWSAVPSSPASR